MADLIDAAFGSEVIELSKIAWIVRPAEAASGAPGWGTSSSCAEPAVAASSPGTTWPVNTRVRSWGRPTSGFGPCAAAPWTAASTISVDSNVLAIRGTRCKLLGPTAHAACTSRVVVAGGIMMGNLVGWPTPHALAHTAALG